MIQDTSAVDRPVSARRVLRHKAVLPALVGLGAVVVAILFVPSFARWLGTETSVTRSRLRIAEVARGDLERDVSVQSRVVAAHHPTTFSPAPGTIRLRVRAGDVVERDQVLAEIESPELASRLEQERSALTGLKTELDRQRIVSRQANLTNRQAVDLAEVELAAAERAMARAKKSQVQGIIDDVAFEKAQDDLERAKLTVTHAREKAGLMEDSLEFELRASELQLQQQRLAVEELERQVDELAVRSPVAGLVSRLDVSDHDAVTVGQPLVAVVDLSAFEVEVMIPESYARELGAGAPAHIEVGGRRYPGRLRSMAPEVEGNQVRGIVAFVGEGPQGLRQNQRLGTRLILESKTQVLKVARGPFLDSGGGRLAWVVEGDVAVRRPIRVGAVSVSDVEVLEGLAAGERIVVSDTTSFQRAEKVYLRD